MSLYNMVNGYNPACILFMPMLGRKQNEWPRFRDCFISKESPSIIIYTRVGGPNRNCDFGEEELYKDPNFLRTWDDEEDNTYGFYEFKVPDRWMEDFKFICAGEGTKVSDEYVAEVERIFPTLAAKGFIRKIFRRAVEENSDE